MNRPSRLQTELAFWLGDHCVGTQRFNAIDDTGRVLDSLNPVVFPDGSMVGIHHTMSKGVFDLCLADSDDGMEWKHVRVLTPHGSQGELFRAKDESWWAAFEYDAPASVHVRLQRYRTLGALRKGEPLLDTTLPRTLAPTAEGTPSFESTSGNTAKLRLHYYKNGDVDRAASAEYRGQDRWVAKSEDRWNRGLEQLGVLGNIGGRTKIRMAGKDWYIQEGQLKKNDWSSWRLWLVDAKSQIPIEIQMRTPKESKSFANPHAIRFGSNREQLLMTVFMPSEGSNSLEKGSLISIRRIPLQWR